MGIAFFVPGIPRPQGSKRKVGKGRYIEASRHLPAWRKAVAEKAREASKGETITGAVKVGAEFVFPRPKRLHGKPTEPFTSPPDVDKLQRAIGDALTIAEAIEDDRYITTWIDPRKRYAEQDEEPGAHITITKYEENN